MAWDRAGTPKHLYADYCQCCGTRYRPPRSYWGASGYICVCMPMKLCAVCGKCRGDEMYVDAETKKPLSVGQPPDRLPGQVIESEYFGHCQCRQNVANAVTQRREVAVMEGW